MLIITLFEIGKLFDSYAKVDESVKQDKKNILSI